MRKWEKKAGEKLRRSEGGKVKFMNENADIKDVYFFLRYPGKMG